MKVADSSLKKDVYLLTNPRRLFTGEQTLIHYTRLFLEIATVVSSAADIDMPVYMWFCIYSVWISVCTAFPCQHACACPVLMCVPLRLHVSV